jgi:hypothetical protein
VNLINTRRTGFRFSRVITSRPGTRGKPGSQLERGPRGCALLGDKRRDWRLWTPCRPSRAQEGLGVVGVAGAGNIRGAAPCPGPSQAGVGGLSAFVNATPLTLLVTMAGVSGISAVAMTRSIQEEDAASAWVWAGVFAMASLLTAWSFWRLV